LFSLYITCVVQIPRLFRRFTSFPSSLYPSMY
jgi:hypothetical protein